MSSLMRVLTVCLAAVALVVVTGCGGGGDTGSKNDYVSSINKIQTDFATSLSATPSSGATSSSDPLAGAKDTFTKIDKGLTKVVAELKGIDPPSDVKNLHQQLITEISQLDQEVKKVSGSVGSGDLKKIAAAQTDFADAATRLQPQSGKTINDINAKRRG